MARQFGGAGGFGGQRLGQRNKLIVVFALSLVVVVCVVVILVISATGQASAPATVFVETKEEAPPKMVEVLIPTQDIEAATPLEASMFRKEERPQINIAPRSVRDYEEIKGQYARSMILKDQPLHRDFITGVRPTNPLTPNIPDGYRAVTMNVNMQSVVEGWAQPGARVDVAWTTNIDGRPGIVVIVQNALVLSANRKVASNARADDPVPTTITLLVTAEDAKKVQLATATGSLSLQLRGESDSGRTDAGSAISTRELLGMSRGDKDEAIRHCQGTVTLGAQRYCVKEGGKLEPLDK